MKRKPRFKVVVVDDETIVLDTIQRYLKKKGWNVKRAEGALEAFSMLSEEDPDVWIIDVKMPGLNGLELAEKIRSSDPKVGIFIMTGYPDDKITEKIKDLGVIKLIEKPVDLSVFHDLLKDQPSHI